MFRQYYPALCRIAYGYIRNRAINEEIVSEVFVKLWNNRDHIRVRTSIKDYLYKSTQNSCIDYLRSNQRRAASTVNLDHMETIHTTLADLDENPLDYIIHLETEKRILEAIEQLPERYRLTFKLNRMDELSYDEVAAAMGITRNTVKSNLRDALLLLKEKLKDISLLVLLMIIYKLIV